MKGRVGVSLVGGWRRGCRKILIIRHREYKGEETKHDRRALVVAAREQSFPRIREVGSGSIVLYGIPRLTPKFCIARWILGLNTARTD